MNKQSLIIVVMAILMVGMLAFGGTYAYFTATSVTKTVTVTTGHVELSTSGTLEVTTATTVLPGDSIASGTYQLTVTTTDTKGEYVAFLLAIDSDNDDVVSAATPEVDDTSWYSVSTDVGTIWIYGSSSTPKAAADKSVLTAFTGIKLSEDLADDYVEANSAATYGYMDVDITITIYARAIQASNVTSAESELLTLFNATKN